MKKVIGMMLVLAVVGVGLAGCYSAACPQQQQASTMKSGN